MAERLGIAGHASSGKHGTGAPYDRSGNAASATQGGLKSSVSGSSSVNGTRTGRKPLSAGSIARFEAATKQHRTGGIWDLLDHPVSLKPAHNPARQPSRHAAHNKPARALAKQPVASTPDGKPPRSIEPRAAPSTTGDSSSAERDRDTVTPSHADPIKALRAIKPRDLGSDNNDATNGATNETTWAIINRFVAWATGPLREQRESTWLKNVPQANVNEAMLRLEQGTKDLDPRVAAAVVKQFLTGNRAFEAFSKDNRESLQNDRLYVRDGDGSGGNPRINIALFMAIADRIAGPPEGDNVVSRLVAAGGWPHSHSVRNAIGNGAGLAYALAYARQLKACGADPAPAYKVIGEGLDRFNAKNQRDYEALLAHRSTLASIIRDIAPVATTEQLAEVTANFLKNHPDWKRDDDALQRRVCDNGVNHLRNLIALDRGRGNGALDAPVLQQQQNRIAGPEANRVAMSTAIHNDPRLAGTDSQLFRDTAAAFAKFTDVITPANRKLVRQVQKLTGELASQALHGRLISMLSRQCDAASLLQFKEDVRALSRFWGISPATFAAISADVDKLVDELASIKDPNTALATRTIAFAKFQKKLDILQAFDTGTTAGQVMRGFAATLSFAAVAFSLKKAIDDPTALNTAKAGTDAANVVQKTSDLLRSLGVKNSAIREIGGGWKIALRSGARIGASEILALASTMIDGARAIDYLAKGDIADAAFSAGIAAGSAISMLPAFIGTGSVAGPIGIAIMTAAFVGQMVWQNARHVHDGEDEVRTGLIVLGYKPEHAAILCERGAYGSGDASGKGQMLALMNYAKAKGMNAAQLRDWINSLTPVQVKHMSELVLYEMGVGNGNLRCDPDEAKKLPAYIIAPGRGAARYGFPAASAVGHTGLRRRTTVDFEQALIRNFIPPPLWIGPTSA